MASIHAREGAFVWYRFGIGISINSTPLLIYSMCVYDSVLLLLMEYQSCYCADRNASYIIFFEFIPLKAVKSGHRATAHHRHKQ